MPEPEAKKEEGEPLEKDPAETTEEKTVGEIIDETVEEGEEKGKKTESEPETVPLSSLLEFKKENKDLRKAIKSLEDKIAGGDSTKKEVADEIEALAEEFDIDPKFASKLAKIMESKFEKKLSDEVEPLREAGKKLTERERADAIDKAFTKHYAEALERAPEFKEIANAGVIKALSLLPENSKKTFLQLIEETYGKAVTGKRTIHETKPGGGKDPEPLDMDRARTDSDYFAEIMKDPARKKEYNTKMLEPQRRRS